MHRARRQLRFPVGHTRLALCVATLICLVFIGQGVFSRVYGYGVLALIIVVLLQFTANNVKLSSSVTQVGWAFVTSTLITILIVVFSIFIAPFLVTIGR